MNVLDFIPPDGDRKNCRLQLSVSIPEAAQLESIANDPMLPFEGDHNRLVRTIIRAGIAAIHEQTEVEDSSFVQSLAPVLGSELLKWSTAACDAFAVAATDHLALATSAGDPDTADEVIINTHDTLRGMKNESAKMMLIRALQRRGFVAAADKLRELLLTMDRDVYQFDNLISEMFT